MVGTKAVVPQVGTAVPEALVVALDQSHAGGIDGPLPMRSCGSAEPVDSLLVGPGMVDQPHVDRIVERFFAIVVSPVITLDAAALLGAAEHRDLTARHAGRLIFTPHAGEMASMLGVSKESVARTPRASRSARRKSWSASWC